ncbi:MAG TPA: carboxypeptidase-like regulatory domain-containing protein [Candidatus Acidoferrales bacterium]|nr:carboxypeptidase-like regulatory domain-containing protein [Candidatus Acidoferrales bacterium]
MSPLRAQFITIAAGVSSVVPAEGGSISFQGPKFTSYFGIGELGGVFGIGTYVKTTIGSHEVTFGDQPIVFDLPTDIFDTNHYFLTRGMGIAAKSGRANLFIFAGGTALASGMQFFRTAKMDSRAGMLFLDVPIEPKLHFYTKTVISRQFTSIQALDWRPHKWLQAGISAGVGSNQPYFAATADVERSWLSLKAGYDFASDHFRRVTAPSVYATEVDRENILAVVKPYSSAILTFGHQNFLQPQGTDPSAPYLRATVNQAQGSFDLAQFRLGAGIFQSHSTLASNMAEAFSASRRVTNRIDFAATYFRTLAGPHPPISNLSTSVRETISPKLSLLQVVNYSQGRTNVQFGGSYVTNRISVGVDYQTLYMPFLANPFSEGVSINLRVRLFRSVQLNGQTFRTADGHLRYTAWADTLLTNRFRAAGSNGEDAFKSLRYMVRGHVQDQTGRPVEGAAIRVGQQLVFTNADGEFFVRFHKAGTLTLDVVLTEFLNPASFHLVSTLPAVKIFPEATAPDIEIVLERK